MSEVADHGDARSLTLDVHEARLLLMALDHWAHYLAKENQTMSGAAHWKAGRYVEAEISPLRERIDGLWDHPSPAAKVK